ncbi:MAG TPA: universal stress protein [Acetobacteraceae bacterium]|jgi:nucleotide-binding universal stress UspA family protein
MPGVILVVLDHPAAAGALLAAARRLAEHCGAARINALVVRAPPETMISPSEEVLTAAREATLRAAEAGRAAQLRAVFDTWAAGLPSGSLDSDWIDLDGIAEMLVEDRGRRADFLVIELPTRRDYGTSWHALRAALFATDRPVLVVPAHCSADFGRRVAIAWRDDERATKAVLAGLRCLTRAEAVFVLAGMRAGAMAPEPPRILAEHGVAAELQVLTVGSGPFGATLLRKAHQLGADMLIMGAYQHSALREFLLGGVTRYMLGHADLPVLLRH